MVNEAPGSIFTPGLVFQTRYRIDEPLAAGGMAQVWRGEDLVLQRPVAVKLLHPHLASDEKILSRFRHEAISAARLSHPNIVPTFDTGADHGVAYIVLGLITGASLSEVLTEHTFTPLQTCALGRQIADALDYAHREGVVHRDIKPANILMVDGDERVMVADFGIARVITESLDPTLTVPGMILGTPDYVAPELMNGKEPTPSVDIFALGILLHQMNCGHTVADVPTQDIDQKDAGSTQICPDIPQPLGHIITRATRHDPAERYNTAAQMRDALHDASTEFQKLLPPEPPSVEHDPNPTEAIPQIKSPAPRILTPTNQPVRDVALARVAAQRRRTATFIAIVVLIAFAIAIGRFFGSLSSNDKSDSTTTTVPIAISSATSFDPQGSDHVENEASAKNVLDANPTTSWTTETYGSRKFGNLKQGVGLVLSLSASTQLENIKVTSTTTDWSAELFVADQLPADLAGWGQPVTSSTKIASGTTTFNLGGTKGADILVWITDLGTANRVNIADITVSTH